ncbi:uncharacterized protein F5891DRAFT_1182676 [Suillus fuscotomentosus]|uniref:Uncharacterized protein n=1 Tax=Suillus fuscotomentosus TaxID=1912939 RepID=A0AAD4EGG4_9AGAM|nr:uncharacterized protein F5891DRAFT_1182676 [Suillus fuscotomentosus]KAG1905612.1 hypothetical protein F5891DRAFT_1182676 [Suillus fuscotomentosus]
MIGLMVAHTALIPVISNNDFPTHGWVSDWGFNDHAGWGLTLDAHKVIFRICDNSRKMMQAVLSTYMPKYTIPPNFSLGWLANRFPTEVALAKNVAEARCLVLDQYGFIAFNVKRDPTWRTCARLSTLKDMIVNTGLMECAYQGCIVNLKEVELSEMIMLVEDKVPLHYQWFPMDDMQHADDGLTIDVEDIQHSDPDPDSPTVIDVDTLSDYSSDDEWEPTELGVQEMSLSGVMLGVATTALLLQQFNKNLMIECRNKKILLLPPVPLWHPSYEKMCLHLACPPSSAFFYVDAR